MLNTNQLYYILILRAACVCLPEYENSETEMGKKEMRWGERSENHKNLL